MKAQKLIIGIGNRFRGDDALGCLLADALRARVPQDVEVIEHNGEPASLIDCWQERQSVILIDAVSSGAEAGTIHAIDLQARGLPEQFRSFSTHAFGIAEAVELARVLNKLPARIGFYGIEGSCFSAATELSPVLQSAARILQQRILDDL
jgi:hydrogenase maturation protease